MEKKVLLIHVLLLVIQKTNRLKSEKKQRNIKCNASHKHEDANHLNPYYIENRSAPLEKLPDIWLTLANWSDFKGKHMQPAKRLIV